MMHVVILGKGSSRGLLNEVPDGAVVWSLNDAVHARSVEHFELHDGLPVLPVVPDGCRVWVHERLAGMWPDGEALDTVGPLRWCPVLWGSDDRVPKYGNTVAHMLARVAELVAHKKAHKSAHKRISDVWLPGVDLMSDRHERVPELEGCLYWCGVLAGLGVRVHVVPDSGLAVRLNYPGSREARRAV